MRETVVKMRPVKAIEKPLSTNPVVIRLKAAFDCLRYDRGDECDKLLDEAEALADQQRND